MKLFLYINAKKIETVIFYFDNYLWKVGIQKNLPSTCINLFLIILMYCTRFLSKSIIFPCIILITLLFIVPVQMDKFSSKKVKKGWTIAFIVFAVIEMIIAIIL